MSRGQSDDAVVLKLDRRSNSGRLRSYSMLSGGNVRPCV